MRWKKLWEFHNGEAVSMGITIASALSVKRGLLAVEDEQRILSLMKHLKLPTRVESEHEQLFDALGKDKNGRATL